MTPQVIGIDLGGTSIKGALVDEAEGILHTDTVPTGADEGVEVVLSRLTGLVAGLLERAGGTGAIAGVGVGAPGSINWERTTILRPPNIHGWESVNVQEALRDRLQVPDLWVAVDNDANVAALGSCHYGAGRMFDHFIMVTLGTGVGGAIIYDNRIFRGATGGAGEIGHMTIDYEGPVANSGVAGAIEAYLGQRFLTFHARYRLINRPRSLVFEMAGPDLEDLSPRILYEAAAAGDEDAIDILRWAGHKLGCALGSAVNLLDIRKIVIGGGVSAAGDYILDAARSTLPGYVTPGLRGDLEIVQERLGNEVALLGAARLVLNVLADEQARQTTPS